MYWDTVQTLIYSDIHSICYSLDGCVAFARSPIPELTSIVLQEYQSIGKPIATAKEQDLQYAMFVVTLWMSRWKLACLHSTKEQRCNRELAIEAYRAS